MIFFTSDLHLNHNKEFIYQARGFKTIWDMNREIIERYNSLINQDDDVYILGDLILGGPDRMEDGLSLLKQLKGNLHIVRGNHDTDKRWEEYGKLYNVVECENAIYLKYNGYHFYLSHYPTLTGNYDINRPLKAQLINICGHTHTKDKFNDIALSPIYHVEVDAHDCFPVSIEQIISE